MKKKDLKTGMVVKLRNGNLYEVMLGVEIDTEKDILRGIRGINGRWLYLWDYNDDLYDVKGKAFEKFDIMEVYKPKYYSSRLDDFLNDYELLWKREQEKFYLKHSWLEGYLNYNQYYDSYILTTNIELEGYKAHFTLDELEKIERELDITLKLNDFILEPVRD